MMNDEAKVEAAGDRNVRIYKSEHLGIGYFWVLINCPGVIPVSFLK